MKYFWVASLLFVFGSTANAVEPAASQASEILQKIDSTKSMMEDRHLEERNLMGELYELNQKIEKASLRRSRLSDLILVTQSKAEKLANEITELKDQLSENRKRLGQRMRLMYKLSGDKVLSFLLSGNKEVSVEKKMRYLKIFAKKDQQLIKDHQIALTKYHAKRDQLGKKVAQLIERQKKYSNEEQFLEARQNRRTSLLKDLRQDKNRTLKTYQQLQAAARKTLGQELQTLLQPSLFEFKGKLSAPTTGTLVSEFGTQMDPEFKFRWNQRGIFYSTPTATPVKAVFDGKVAFLGQLQGSGQTVILDHGDHYYSVYSGLKKSSLSKGEKVTANQPIGLTGRHYRGRGLYFEIRHYSQPLDPSGWMEQHEIAQLGAQQGVNVSAKMGSK